MLVAAMVGALLGLVHASLTVWLGVSQHVSGWGSRCWPPVSPPTPTG